MVRFRDKPNGRNKNEFFLRQDLAGEVLMQKTKKKTEEGCLSQIWFEFCPNNGNVANQATLLGIKVDSR